jgi:hypothetical protein
VIHKTRKPDPAVLARAAEAMGYEYEQHPSGDRLIKKTIWRIRMDCQGETWWLVELGRWSDTAADGCFFNEEKQAEEAAAVAQKANAHRFGKVRVIRF